MIFSGLGHLPQSRKVIRQEGGEWMQQHDQKWLKEVGKSLLRGTTDGDLVLWEYYVYFFDLDVHVQPPLKLRGARPR